MYKVHVVLLAFFYKFELIIFIWEVSSLLFVTTKTKESTKTSTKEYKKQTI